MINAPLRVLAALVGVVGLLTFTACTSNDGGADQQVASLNKSAPGDQDQDKSGAPLSDAEMEAAYMDYAECMREHGIDEPDPQFEDTPVGRVPVAGDPPDGDPDVYAAVEEACDPILDKVFASFTPTPEEQAEIERQGLEYARCMRDQGLDWPDPVFDENGAQLVQDVHGYDDPVTLEASAECREIITSATPEQP